MHLDVKKRLAWILSETSFIAVTHTKMQYLATNVRQNLDLGFHRLRCLRGVVTRSDYIEFWPSLQSQ